MLVIVGDTPVEELRKLAESAFADWKGKGPVVARVRPSGEPAPRGLEALSQSHPALPSTVSACRFGPPDTEAPGSLERMRREALSAVWTTVIGNRLNEATARPGSPLLSAGMIVNHDLPDARAACLLVLPNNDKWREALAEAQGELRRFARDGAGEAEVKIAVEELLSRLGGQLFQSGTRVTPVLAEQITGSYLESEVFQHPSAAMETFRLLVAGVTAEDLKKAFDEDWSGTGPLISATAASAPPREALLAAWQENEAAAPLAAYARQAEARWAYWEFGKPGKVAKREVMTNPDFIRLHFRNGVVVNFKPTSLQSGGVEIRVRFGHGERGLDKATRVPAGIAASVFPMGGLGKMDFQQIGSALTNTTWGFNLEVEATAFVLASSTLSDQVEQQLRLLTAYMTDPAFGPAIDEKLPTVIDIGYRSYRADPNAVAVEALEKALFPDQLSMPPRAEIDAFRARDFERMLKPALTGAPIEVTIVGDIAEARVTKALATTFGALKRRPGLAPPTGKGPFRYFPKTLPAPLTAYHEGPADKAAALLMWPLYVASPERRAEEYAIGLVSEIFQTRLIQQIRAGMGKTYSPNVANVMIDQADQGYVAAQIETSPADLDQVIAAARGIAADLAAGSISQQELEAARQPLIAARLQAQSRNEAWAGILSHSFRHPEAIEELTGYQRDVERLTLEDVRRAAATWLGRDPIVSRALPATAAPTP
jgi:zinc protease